MYAHAAQSWASIVSAASGMFFRVHTCVWSRHPYCTRGIALPDNFSGEVSTYTIWPPCRNNIWLLVRKRIVAVKSPLASSNDATSAQPSEYPVTCRITFMLPPRSIFGCSDGIFSGLCSGTCDWGKYREMRVHTIHSGPKNVNDIVKFGSVADLGDLNMHGKRTRARHQEEGGNS